VQIFGATLLFSAISVLGVRAVEALETAVNAKVEWAIANISMKMGNIKTLQFIFVSPSQLCKQGTNQLALTLFCLYTHSKNFNTQHGTQHYKASWVSSWVI
jgi:hypothetical protein